MLECGSMDSVAATEFIYAFRYQIQKRYMYSKFGWKHSNNWIFGRFAIGTIFTSIQIAELRDIVFLNANAMNWEKSGDSASKFSWIGVKEFTFKFKHPRLYGYKRLGCGILYFNSIETWISGFEWQSFDLRKEYNKLIRLRITIFHFHQIV